MWRIVRLNHARQSHCADSWSIFVTSSSCRRIHNCRTSVTGSSLQLARHDGGVCRPTNESRIHTVMCIAPFSSRPSPDDSSHDPPCSWQEERDRRQTILEHTRQLLVESQPSEWTVLQWRQAEECLDALGRFEVEVEENAAWGLKLYRSMMDRHVPNSGGGSTSSRHFMNTAVIRCGAITVLSKDPQMAHEAQEIWHAMVEEHTASSLDLQTKNVAQVRKFGPNVICATACMAAHAKSNSTHGAARALEMLQQLTQLYHAHVHSNAPQPIQAALRPNAVAYETLLDAFSRRVTMTDPTIVPPAHSGDNHNPDEAKDVIPAAVMAQSLFDQIKLAAANGRIEDELTSRKCDIEIVPGIRPTIKMYNIVMAAWARQARVTRDPAAAQQAEHLFHELRHSERLEPTTEASQTSVMSALCSVLSALCSVGHVDRATQLLMEVEQEMGVTEHSYTTVLHGWATLGKPQEAQTILVRQLHRYETHAGTDTTIQPPSVHSFNAVLHAWAKSRQPDAAQKACEILTLMETIGQTLGKGDTGKRNISLAPDLITYNTVLDAIRSRTAPKTTHRQNNRAASLGEEDDTMVETLLENMKALYQKEKESATSLEQRTKLKEQMRIGFNSAINVFASRQNQFSGEKAERLLIEMEESVGADLISYNATLKAWAKSPRSCRPSQRAETLLKRMLLSPNHAKPKPDLTTYNTVLDCWARNGDRKDAGLKALALLQHLKDVNLVPNLITYHSAMNVLAKHATPGSAERAESILIQLEQYGTPALLTYCLAVQAWSYSEEEDRLRRARHVLDRMRDFFQTQRKSQQDRNVLRNAHNSLLGACAQSKHPKDALELAVEAFSHVMDSNGVIEADESTLLKFLQTCYHHLPANTTTTSTTQRDPNKDAILYALCTDAFRQACRRGVVSEGMMHYFLHVAPPDTFRAMLQSAGLPPHEIDSNPLTSFHAENLPKEWTQHANWKRGPR